MADQPQRPAPRVMVVNARVDEIRWIHATLSGEVRIVQSTSARRALHLARLAAPDLMLIDMDLPDLDGLNLTAALRADAATRDLRVVILADPGHGPDPARIGALGIAEVLLRPLDAGRLRQAVTPADRGAARPRDPALDRLAGLPGLDLAAGLRHVGGSPALYLSVLEKLLADHAAFPDQIAAAIRDRDSPQAMRLAHTAKTLCRTIGAEPLADLALAVEYHLKSDAPGLPATDRFAAEYSRMIANIRRAITD